MGRKSKFDSSVAEKMLALYSDPDNPRTDKQVAEIIGVTERTINNWKGLHPEFFHSLKEAKAGPDMRVQASLYHRAIGYSHPEEKIFVFEGMPIRVMTRKHYPPDVTAQIFWLKNRQPDLWRDTRKEIEPAVMVSQVPQFKKTFEQFCEVGLYPPPFMKQNIMKDFCLEDLVPRMLLGARGYGKTDYMTINGVAYAIYCDWYNHIKNPTLHPQLLETNLIITKSDKRNAALVGEISRVLTANGVPLEKSNASEIRVQGLLGKDHSVEAITIKTSMRGRHPKRTVMDDPVTEEDTSEAMRTLVKKKYDEAYKLCKNIVIIGQPAHQFDLYAELREKLKVMLVPHGEIPELDSDLMAMKFAGVDAHSIDMSYHLRIPQDGSSIFSSIKYIDSLPAGDSVAYIDPSDGGDYTAMTIGKGHFAGVAIHGHAWKKAWYHCLDDIVSILLARGVKRVCFETNHTGTQPIIQLRQLLAPHGIGVTGKHSTSDKHATIQAAGSYAHMIFLSNESDKVYTDQVVKYEYKSKYDDAPDSLARMLQWLGLIREK